MLSELFNDIFYTLGGSEYFDDVDRLAVYNRCVAEGVKNCKCTQLGSHGVSKMVVNKKINLPNEERASRACRWAPGGSMVEFHNSGIKSFKQLKSVLFVALF